MGNDSSRLKGLVIDKTAVEVNDFWTLYWAETPTTSNEDGRQLLSIFQGEQVVKGQLWVAQGPLERAIKNLMIYRHPYILKYVTTWEQGGQKHLATERVRPLTDILTAQSDIQVCLGLRTILCSLIFLVEKAMGRHLNICTSSIYITDNGSWRLAGFEYVWKSKEVTKTLLELAKSHRYKKSMDDCETLEHNIDTIEQYAFATLCEEILNRPCKNELITPHVRDFREYCATHLKHKNAQMRPKLSAVLLHPFFNHEFVLIHCFLFELPLKSVPEKQQFFTSLIDRLRAFNEEMVGALLAEDLFARMVLLDPTAQLCVTPYVLQTKADHAAALFSPPVFGRYIMPHIKRMFRLRDAQIRLILLEYFMEFVRLLTKEELEQDILPHLLAGMNDTNDVLVAKTLRCLADIIPILGAATVIGGQRLRLFSDGRPQAAVPDATSHWVEPRSITPVMGGSLSVDYMVSGSPIPDALDLSGSFSSLPAAVAEAEASGSELLDEMPPRLSPDGGEDENKSVIIADGHLLIASTNAVESERELHTPTSSQGYTDIPLHDREETPHASHGNDDYDDVAFVRADNDIEDEAAWSDWETDELQQLNGHAPVAASQDMLPANNNSTTLPPANATPTHSTLSKQSNQKLTSSTNSLTRQHSTKPAINDDLSAFDIIVQKTNSSSSTAGADGRSNEFDFFKDMEPIIAPKAINNVTLDIPATTKLNALATKREEEDILIDSSRFAASTSYGTADDDDSSAVGWAVDDELEVDTASAWRE